VFERFTDRARRVVVLSQEEARLLNHNYIGTEHILLGLISEGEGVAAKVLESLEISLPDARAQVEEIIGHGGQAPSGHIPFTPRAKKVLELSLREALQLGHNYIGTEHILLGLIREGEGVAAQVLTNLGAELPNVRQRVIQLLSGYAGGMSTTSRTRGGEDPRHGRVLSAVTARSPWTCSFCSRDLWEAEHYVAGPAAFMCDICIATAHLALEAVPADQQILTLPPRVFGTPPEDDPGAVDQIVEALDAVFGSGLTDQSAVYLEDGKQLIPILLATRERHNVRISQVVVERVRFSTPVAATVGYAMTLENGTRFGFVGTMMRVDKRWLVTRTTIADALKPAGVTLPPPPKQLDDGALASE
jgi:hypothetical protein